MNKALEISALNKSFGDGENALSVIRNLNFSMERGNFESVMGPSGSGKSTFIHLAAGLISPDYVSISVAGQSITGLSDSGLTVFRRRHVGLVFQDFNLIPTLTAEENVALPLLLDGTESKHRAYIDELISLLGLTERRSHLPMKLSGGERQRVAIARALAGKPDIVLADEPTGNLDSPAAHALCELLKKINRTLGTTILIVSHDPIVAAATDKVHILRDGAFADAFVTDGSAESVMAHYLAVMR